MGQQQRRGVSRSLFCQRSFDKVPFSAPTLVSADVASLFVYLQLGSDGETALHDMHMRTFEIEIIKKELF